MIPPMTTALAPFTVSVLPVAPEPRFTFPVKVIVPPLLVHDWEPARVVVLKNVRAAVSEFVIPEEIVSVFVFAVPEVSNAKAVAPPVLRKTSVSVDDAARSVMLPWRPAELLNVAALALLGTPTLQLPPVPQREEDVLVQSSTTWARPA